MVDVKVISVVVVVVGSKLYLSVSRSSILHTNWSH